MGMGLDCLTSAVNGSGALGASGFFFKFSGP